MDKINGVFRHIALQCWAHVLLIRTDKLLLHYYGFGDFKII